jgi:O-Antigen ligase
MFLVAIIDVIVVVTLCWVAKRRGLAEALPYFTFFVVLIPDQSQFKLPGLFDLTSRRVAVATLLALYVTTPKPRNSLATPLKYLMLLSAAWVAISTFSSLQFSTSFKQLIAQVAEYYIVYYIFVHTVSRMETIHRVASALVLAIGVCCVFACFEAYLNWSVMSLFPAELWNTYEGNSAIYVAVDRGLRVQSTFPHPILFGDAIAMALPIALYLLSARQLKLPRKVMWATILLMFWSVYKTSSRGPWLAAGVSLGLLFLMMRNRARKQILIFVALGASVLVIRPGVWESIFNMYSGTLDPTSPLGMSYDYRYALANSVQKAAQENVERGLFGYGLGTFRELGLVVEFRDTQHSTSYRWHTCDSSWLLFLYETGYGGVFIMAMLLGKPALLMFRTYFKASQSDRYFSAALFTSMISFYFLMGSVAAYAWGQPGQMLWIVISLAMCYDQLNRREKSGAPGGRVRVHVRTSEVSPLLQPDHSAVVSSLSLRVVRLPQPMLPV